MSISDIKLTANDLIKVLGFVGSLMTLYFQLRSDMKELIIQKKADDMVVNYRINSLEEEQRKLASKLTWFATLPESPKIKHE
jgi:hypothetical protein